MITEERATMLTTMTRATKPLERHEDLDGALVVLSS